MSFCATGKACAMRTEKKVLEFNDCTVTITVRQKTPPAADRNNDVYEFWNEELRDLYGLYEDK